jgi:hypothetical protein
VPKVRKFADFSPIISREWDSSSVSFARLMNYKVKSIVFSLLRSPLMDLVQ